MLKSVSHVVSTFNLYHPQAGGTWGDIGVDLGLIQHVIKILTSTFQYSSTLPLAMSFKLFSVIIFSISYELYPTLNNITMMEPILVPANLVSWGITPHSSKTLKHVWCILLFPINYKQRFLAVTLVSYYLNNSEYKSGGQFKYNVLCNYFADILSN